MVIRMVRLAMGILLIEVIMKMRGGKLGCCENWNCKNSCFYARFNSCMRTFLMMTASFAGSTIHMDKLGGETLNITVMGANEMGDCLQPVDLDFTMTETCPDIPTFSPTFYPTFSPTFYPTFGPIDFPSTLLFPTPQLNHLYLEFFSLEEIRMKEEIQIRFMKWWIC